MENNYVVYFVDVESTGLDTDRCEIIELSLIRLTDNLQKTWLLKATDPETIETGALRINGHKKEDITWASKFGRETYQEPSKVIVEIENWVLEGDNAPQENKLLAGQNILYDKTMLEKLWKRNNSFETFPWGRRILDTSVIEFFLDYCRGGMAEGYSLNNLIKHYGVRNEKKHSAASDIRATVEVFEKQVKVFRKILNK